MATEKRGVLQAEAAPPKPNPKQTKIAADTPPATSGNDLASRLADAAAKKPVK